jgi:glutathione S-transferase
MDFLLAAINTPYVAVFKDAKLPPAERSPAFVAQAKDLAEQLAIVDRHLEGKAFLALGKLTIADIALGPILKRCMGFDIERPAFENLARWLAALESRPSFQIATGSKPAAAA